MMAWEDSTLPGVECPVPAGAEQTSPQRGDIFCLCMSPLGPDPRLFPITACIWDNLIVCCLNVAVQAQTDPSLLFMPPCFFPNTDFLFFPPPLWERSFRLIATFTPLQIVQETAKLCSRPTQLRCLWTWQSDGISFVETYLMSSDLLSLMTRDKEGHCCASGCVEWAERQSEWFLSTSRTD